MLFRIAIGNDGRFATREEEYDVSQCEDGSERIPQAQVTTRTINRQTPNQRRAIEAQVNVARVPSVVLHSPSRRRRFGNKARPERIANAVAANPCGLTFLKNLKEHIKAHERAGPPSIVNQTG